jgi:hypothetical protein
MSLERTAVDASILGYLLDAPHPLWCITAVNTLNRQGIAATHRDLKRLEKEGCLGMRLDEAENSYFYYLGAAGREAVEKYKTVEAA